MDVFGKKDDEGIQKMLAAAEAMKAAGLPVPDSIKEQLGEDFESKDPNELCTVELKAPSVLFHQMDDRTGLKILLDKLPTGLTELMIFPILAPKKDEEPKAESESDSDESKKDSDSEKTSDSSPTPGTDEKSESTSTEPKESSKEDTARDHLDRAKRIMEDGAEKKTDEDKTKTPPLGTKLQE